MSEERRPVAAGNARSGLPALRPRPVPNGLSHRFRNLVSRREDQAFLPAHLEILETPPSPYATVFAVVICLLFAAAIGWSFFAELDIYAIATGRIQPSGRSKVVQPFETSKVRAVFVENGSTVKAGAPLIQLDATEAEADYEARLNDYETMSAEVARRTAAIAAVQDERTDVTPAYPADVPEAIRLRQQAAMTSDVAQYLADRQALLAQIGEKAASQQRFKTSIAARERLRAVLKERSDMREELVAKSAGTRAAVLDAAQQVEQASADLAYDRGQLLEAEAAAQSIERRLVSLTRDTVAKQTQALTEAAQKRDSLRQEVVKTKLKRDRMLLTAPIDGTVQQLAVTTVGQVVTPGQPLLVVVPSGGSIEVEALVQNRDIGFVMVGQSAIVKVDAFPYTRYGTLDGKVVRISRDAIDERDAVGSTDPLTLARGQGVSPVSGTPRTQDLVFPVTIELEATSIMSDGKAVPLSPGMTTTIEIRTGKRRAIDYVLSPIRETTSTAGRER